jgi:hypothetical protein
LQSGHHVKAIGIALAAGLSALALAACGGGAAGSGAATGATASQLLKATFSGSHKLTSGNLNVELMVTPSGSSVLTTPITLSFGGPFEDLGPGRVGNSDFTLRVTALGTSLISLGLESLDGKGYVSLGGTSYRLPARQYRQIESRISQTGSGSGQVQQVQGIIGKLGIDPLRWLTAPQVVGSSTVGGASTTHIRAGLNVGALIDDVGVLLSKASALGVPHAGKLSLSIPPATKAKIVAEAGRPRVDIWTGRSDKTLRKLAVSLTIPVSGRISSALGGLKSAALSLVVAYENLGQPQTISAPAPKSLQPYARFKAQAQALAGAIGGALSSKAG